MNLPKQPLEFLNLLNLTDLRLNLPGFDLKQRLPMTLALNHAVKHYLDDLVKNQKLNVAKSVGPIRTVVNLTSALVGLVSTPYQAYREDRGMMRGLTDGVWNFYTKLSEEGGYLLARRQ